MLCHFSTIQASPVLHEQHLKSKICQLQTQLVEFNRRISPAKEKQTTTATQCEISLECSWQDRWLVFCLLTLFRTSITLIGCVVYVAWPFCFPAFVYMGEGFTYFFWQVVSISILVSLAMLAKMASDINQLRLEYTRKLCRKMRDIADKWTELCASELDIFTKKLIFIAMVFGFGLLILFLIYEQSIDVKYIIGAALLATGFCCGAGMTYIKQRNRGCDGILPLINCEGTGSISPIQTYQTSTPSSPWLHVLDFAHEHGFTPLKFHRSPPPTYQEAVEDDIPIRKSPACRMALFQ